MSKTRITGIYRQMLVVAVASIATLGLASPALAVTHHPTGVYAPFADCPLSNSSTELCIAAKTTSGEFKIGKQTVPITNPITLQGGAKENPTTEQLEFIGAEDGNTLSKTPQNVPGGLLDLVNCKEISNFIERVLCEATFENGVTGVTATSELAAPATSIQLSTTNLLLGSGTALQLPLKVKLSNPLLGESCYIGSNSKPIVIPFTTGATSPPPPNKSIKGSPGELEILEGGLLARIKKNSLVNNSFAAPGAEGCGGIFAFLIDPIIDAKLGLPAAAGQNTAILNGSLEDAAASAVKASE
jgi:hypothetical protein